MVLPFSFLSNLVENYSLRKILSHEMCYCLSPLAQTFAPCSCQLYWLKLDFWWTFCYPCACCSLNFIKMFGFQVYQHLKWSFYVCPSLIQMTSPICSNFLENSFFFFGFGLHWSCYPSWFRICYQWSSMTWKKSPQNYQPSNLTFQAVDVYRWAESFCF